MFSQETSNDILVIHQNRIVFSSGQGPLTKHSKISATVTQVLTLFSERIMKGEQIHFIRFEKHRMIFLFSQKMKENQLAAIVLIPIERSARQVIPAMSIVLHMLEEFLKGNIEDAKDSQLDCFYQILSSPENSLFLVPRSPEGILAALVILTAFAHDMQLGIQRIASNLHFVDPNKPLELNEIIRKSETNRILSFVPLPGVEDNTNILLFGLDSPRKQYFSAYPDEQIYDVISRIFGNQSNAAKMRNFISNKDAQEIAQSISLIPQSEDDFIRKEVLLATVLQPGKDIIVTMTTPVMQKLRSLASTTPIAEEVPVIKEIPVFKEPSIVKEAPALEEAPIFKETPVIKEAPVVKEPIVAKEVPVVTTDLESLPIESPLKVSKKVQPRLHPTDFELDTTLELVAEPDAIPEETQGLVTKPVETIPVRHVDSDVLTRLDETRRSGFEYRFDSIPLIFDTAPYEINLPETQNLPFQESNITIRLFQEVSGHFAIHIYTVRDRLSDLRSSLEDLSFRIGGEIHLRENHVSLVGPIDKQQMTLRALLWLSIVEYLTQVEMKLQKPSSLFEIPKEGSILIIPPKREYIKGKIPSKFQNFVEELIIRSQIEQEELWTLGKAQNEIISHIMSPLKYGNGVVFVASENNQEMEEIALFLLHVSEICGIGFSRW
ncbi:MAG: hypothetical protein JSU57_03495 [Candidatus Heimdallarchaeota archaeon]|nr:MAG: hypothetical protein JSU57_03495 [Candidatus Heimdallarchaeota archaeon]